MASPLLSKQHKGPCHESRQERGARGANYMRPIAETEISIKEGGVIKERFQQLWKVDFFGTSLAFP